MNPAQVHLAINHLPLAATLFGALLLFIGLLRRNGTLSNTGLIFLIASALIAIPTNLTGEEAEEMVEHMNLEAGINDYIHHHEEEAETAMWLSIAVGALGLLALMFNYQKKSFARLLSWITCVASIGSLFILLNTAHSGGEIRHTEIRDGFVMPIEHDDHHDDDDSH